MMTDRKITFDSFIRGMLSVALIVFILYIINRLSGVLLPFFIAWIIAYLTYPLVIFFQVKLKLKSRVLSIFAVLLSILLVITLVSLFFVPPMVAETKKVTALINLYFNEGVNHSTVPGFITDFFRNNIDYQSLLEMINLDNISKALEGILPKIGSLISTSYNILAGAFTAVVMLLYYFFILLDYEQIANDWVHLLPQRYQKVATDIVTDVKDSMNRYFRGQALVAFLVGVLFSIGFVIIDFPLAIVLGMFIGLLNMVPYLQIVGLVPTIFLALLKAADTGENFWWIILMALIVFAVVQLIQDSIIVPKVMGKITGLNPAIILLSLSIWGSLMGIIGMIIALPCTTLLLSYYQKYIHHEDMSYLRRKEDKENEE